MEGAVCKLAVFRTPPVASLARKIWFSSSRLATTISISPSLSRSATMTLVVGESTSKAPGEVPPIGVAVGKSPDVGER